MKGKSVFYQHTNEAINLTDFGDNPIQSWINTGLVPLRHARQQVRTLKVTPLIFEREEALFQYGQEASSTHYTIEHSTGFEVDRYLNISEESDRSFATIQIKLDSKNKFVERNRVDILYITSFIGGISEVVILVCGGFVSLMGYRRFEMSLVRRLYLLKSNVNVREKDRR